MGSIQAEDDSSTIDGITIESISFIDDQGNSLDHPTLIHITSLKIGEFLDTEKLITDVNALSTRFPQYSEVTAKIDPGSSEEFIQVVFEFQLKRKVKYISLILEKVEEVLNLRDKLVVQKGLLLKGSAIDQDKMTIKEIYQKLGYPFVSVVEQINSLNDNGEVSIKYLIKSIEGKINLKKLSIRGNDSFKDSKLKKSIKSKGSNFLSKNSLNIFKLEKDQKELTKYYHDKGFLEAIVTHKISSANKKGYRNVVFTVIENNQSIINTISINGNKVKETTEILELFDYAPNNPYNEKVFRIGLQKIREAYGRMGYPLVNAVTDYNPEDKKLSLYISEGEMHHIAEIKVTGNQYMEEEVILRDVSFVPGEIVNTDEISKSLNKMRATGYYDDVRIDYSPNASGSGVIYVTIQEARSHFIEFGVGYSTSGMGGDIGYRNPNLFDAGRSISLNASKDEELLKLGLIYKDPHLLGSDYEMDVSLNYGEGEQTDYQRSRTSMRIMIKKLITDNLKIGIGTRVEFMDITDVSTELANEVHDATGTSRTIGMISTIVYKDEEVDETGDSIRGHRMKLALFPSYSDQGTYMKAITEFMAHRSLGTNENGSHHVISGRVTLGYSSENTPFYEKFYAGGMSTIRGYKSRSLSPEGSVVGGSYVASANLTYSFPLWKNILKGVVFVEAASVANDFSELSNVRVVGGVGIRANLRDTFLRNNIEAGFAVPLNGNDSDDILRPFYFMLGNYDPAYDL
jgi:outer membrane protein insertion porin family